MHMFEILHLYSIIIVTAPCVDEGSRRAVRFISVRGQKKALIARRQIMPAGYSAQMGSYEAGQLKKVAGPQHVGPPRGPSYDPYHGYEPYWVGGDWVLNKTWTDKDATTNAPVSVDGTTAKSYDHCGYKCNDLYSQYGPVCGRNANGKYKSFDNYCELLAGDCAYREGWLVAYRGACAELRTYQLKARQQHNYHMQLVRHFYHKYGRGVGSAVSTTHRWTHGTYFDDDRRK